MAKNKGYIPAIIAGIIAIIVLITPVAYHSGPLIESYIWMWGLYSWKVLLGSTNYNFSEDSDYLTWGLIGTLLIIIAIILLILTGVKAKKRNRSYRFLWFLCGLLLIAAPLVYYFGLLEQWPTWVGDLFWSFYEFHFAFYGSFIAGGIAILGAFIK
jgi:hypothetical protein